MTIEKAMELLELERDAPGQIDHMDRREALNLGINALEEILELHSPATHEDIIDLPGMAEK